MIPIRCYSCGKPIAHLWEAYKEKTRSESAKEALDELGLERYCCRAIFLGVIDEENTINFTNLD